ncbi:hypothetical protein Poly59_28150 [Rubripirellula reticaptiva]|uniref:Uncharacterized protein n=1 Tax=Rubripirellula reticaptiva TaxID=2528013 RepID=A0A5C6ES94_9BACT|nr:hypothetical protein Poly59_28150 [Rubripirellula reticaptiva]
MSRGSRGRQVCLVGLRGKTGNLYRVLRIVAIAPTVMDGQHPSRFSLQAQRICFVIPQKSRRGHFTDPG